MPKTEDLRVPPHSIEAEQAVIGGLLLEEKAWDEVADKLNEEDFYAKDYDIPVDRKTLRLDTGKLTIRECVDKILSNYRKIK